MKKKIIALLLLTVIVLSFVSCGEKAPKDKARDKLIEIAEDFLDYDISAKEARTKIDAITIPNEDSKGGDALSSCKLFLSSHLLYFETNGSEDDYNEIKDIVNHMKNKSYDY